MKGISVVPEVSTLKMYRRGVFPGFVGGGPEKRARGGGGRGQHLFLRRPRIVVEINVMPHAGGQRQAGERDPGRHIKNEAVLARSGTRADSDRSGSRERNL